LFSTTGRSCACILAQSAGRLTDVSNSFLSYIQSDIDSSVNATVTIDRIRDETIKLERRMCDEIVKGPGTNILMQ